MISYMYYPANIGGFSTLSRDFYRRSEKLPNSWQDDDDDDDDDDDEVLLHSWLLPDDACYLWLILILIQYRTC